MNEPDTQGSAGAPAAEGLNLARPEVVIDLFERAAKANRETPCLKGSTVVLPDKGTLIATGDLHDNGLNYRRILKLAALDRDPSAHLVLHEVIHGEHRINGRDMSIRMLAKIAALKLQYPDRVHILHSNHELSQYHSEEILKGGVSVVQCFDDGVDFLYGESAPEVREAMNGFLRSYALTIRCPNGIMISHSLPGPFAMQTFDTDVVNRELTDEDLAPEGSAYSMCWGRLHDIGIIGPLREAWGVEQFIIGHQPAEMGYETEGESVTIIASDHSHGVALPIDLSKSYDQLDLIDELIPLVSVVL